MGKIPGGDTKGARVQGRGAGGGPWTVYKGALTYMNKTDTPQSQVDQIWRKYMGDFFIPCFLLFLHVLNEHILLLESEKYIHTKKLHRL